MKNNSRDTISYLKSRGSEDKHVERLVVVWESAQAYGNTGSFFYEREDRKAPHESTGSARGVDRDAAKNETQVGEKESALRRYVRGESFIYRLVFSVHRQAVCDTRSTL